MGERETPWGLAALGAVGMAVFCALPLQVGAGFFAAAAGFGLGSWIVIVAGIAVVAVGVWRWRQKSGVGCEADVSADRGPVDHSVDDRIGR